MQISIQKNWTSNLEKTGYFCLLILLLRIPFVHTEALKSFALLGGFLFSTIAALGRKDFRWGNKKGDWPVLAFLIWAGISSVMGKNPAESLDGLRGSFLQYFLGYILASRLVWTKKRAEIFLFVLLVPVTIISLSTFGDWGKRAQGNFHHPNQLAWFLVLTLPLILPLVENSKKLWQRIFCGLILSLGVVALVFTQSRGGWIAFMVMMVLVLWLGRNETRQVSLVLVGLFLVLILTNPAGRERVGEIFKMDTYLKDRISFRYDAWKAGFGMIADNPVTGVGFGYERYRELYVQYADHPSPEINHAHNNIIEITVETGILGTLFFLWFCLEMGLYFWKSSKVSPNDFSHSWYIAFFLMLVGWFIFSQSTYTYIRHENGLLQMLLFGSCYLSKE